MTNSPRTTEPANDPDEDNTEITASRPTTAEEAMDADDGRDGFANESAYTPAEP